MKAHRIDASTLQRYEQDVRLHLVPTLGKVALSRLTASQIQVLYADLLAEGLALRTVRHVHMVLNAALMAAVRLNLVQRNVCDFVEPPKPARAEIAPLTPEQAQIFRQTVIGDAFEALFVLALETGMRQGELLALKWRDVDLDSSTLQVRATLQRAPRHKRIKNPKTASSRRRIALTPQAAEALRAHRARQNVARLAAGHQWQDNDLLFPSRTGAPANKTTLTDWHFKPALRRAGLPDIRFHDLRHTCATLLLLQGVHPKVVSELLQAVSKVAAASGDHRP